MGGQARFLVGYPMSKTIMSKTQLAAIIAAETGISRKQTAEVLACLTKIVKAEIEAGRKVNLLDLVKVSIRDRPERTVRNPATGEKLIKPADRSLRVSASKALKAAANGETD